MVLTDFIADQFEIVNTSHKRSENLCETMLQRSNTGTIMRPHPQQIEFKAKTNTDKTYGQFVMQFHYPLTDSLELMEKMYCVKAHK